LFVIIAVVQLNNMKLEQN